MYRSLPISRITRGTVLTLVLLLLSFTLTACQTELAPARQIAPTSSDFASTGQESSRTSPKSSTLATETTGTADSAGTSEAALSRSSAETELPSEENSVAATGSKAETPEKVGKLLEANAEQVRFQDDLGTVLEIARPQRVVAMIGSYADLWSTAGGKESIVAAANDSFTSFSLNLAEDVSNIGSSKKPSLDLIFSAKPDLILASTNTQADLDLQESFANARIPVCYFGVETFDDYLRVLRIFSALTGSEENYTRYGTQQQTAIEQQIARQDGSHPSVLYLRASQLSVHVKSSKISVLGEMLADLGCNNIADNKKSLLDNLSMESILTEDPQYIFIVMQGQDTEAIQRNLDEALMANPAWQKLSAVRNQQVYYMDPQLFNLKPNARWAEAYEKLADILYPKQ